MTKETSGWKYVTGAFVTGYAFWVLLINGITNTTGGGHPELKGRVYFEPVSYVSDINNVYRKREERADPDGDGFLSKDELVEYFSEFSSAWVVSCVDGIFSCDKNEGYLRGVRYRMSRGLPLDKEDGLTIEKIIERKGSRNPFSRTKTTISDLERVGDLDSDGTFEIGEGMEIIYGREPIPLGEVYLPPYRGNGG